MPFFAITLLAGLQTITPTLYEAAAIDGASGWQRFWHVTWPLLMPVTMVVVLFSVIMTFADFQLVYILTGGGPANSTHLFATYAYQIGIGTGKISEGAAVSLAMFPFLFLIVIFQLWYIRRGEEVKEESKKKRRGR
jgi:multiple sugar transport system permease protein